MPAAITDLRAWAVRQPGDGASWIVVRLDTAAGISGWGETAGGPEEARALEAAKGGLLGRDASAIEPLRLANASAALNLAALDVLGKLCKAPVYDVVGGATRTKARALARLGADWTASLRRIRDAGFRAAVIPLALPDGPARGRGFYTRVREDLEKLRTAGGGEVDFVLDAGSKADAAEVAGLARELESFHLLWIEGPGTPGAESSTPVGRDAADVAGVQELLTADAVDVLRPDVGRWGITQARKAAALAETYYVAVAPRSAGGPIATAAGLQLAASIPNFFALEVPFPADERDRRLRRELAGGIEDVKDGWLELPSEPGLGVSVDVEALERHRIR